MHYTILFLFVVLNLVIVAECKKILGIYGHPGKSHQLMGEVIFKELAKRGHQVTMVSPFPLKTPVPNYRDIVLEGFVEELAENEDIFLEMEDNDFLNLWQCFEIILQFTDKTFSYPAVQELIKSGEKFDLIMMDFFARDAELFFGNIFQAPVILTSSFGTQAEANYLLNNPEPYSYVPLTGLSYTDEMGFFERIGNAFISLYMRSLLYYYGMQHQKILDKHFKNAPRIDELRSNVDLLFSNSHPTFESIRPYLPNIISIGGIHVQEPKPLTQDLQKYLDDSPQGVIYFSLGSHMKTSILPKDKLESILRAFSRLPQNVLMKWESDYMPNLPKNVIVRKWMPQDGILAHPNTKAFITHGGLMSKIEAIYHATPMLGLPLFGDQKSNVAHSVHEGIGLQLFLKELTEDNLFEALHEIINNSSYSNNIKKKSALLRDQPLKPMDAAIYWAEFVMTHNGTKHLQNRSMKLNRVQNLLLDIVAFFLAILLLISYIVKKLYRLITDGKRKHRGNQSKKLKKQ